MQQPQLHTEQQQVTGSWIATVATPEDMLIGNSASQVARSASAVAASASCACNTFTWELVAAVRWRYTDIVHARDLCQNIGVQSE